MACGLRGIGGLLLLIATVAGCQRTATTVETDLVAARKREKELVDGLQAHRVAMESLRFRKERAEVVAAIGLRHLNQLDTDGHCPPDTDSSDSDSSDE